MKIGYIRADKSMIEPEYAGKYRDIQVVVSGSKYPVTSYEKIECEMKKLCQWIDNGRQSQHPVEYAALIHKQFVFIHPFKDGNGRVARLLMNTALIQSGYMLVVIPPILRSEYIMLLEKAHVDDKLLIEFIAERVKESQKDIMRMLHVQ